MLELVLGLELETNINTINKWKEEEVALEVEKFLGGLELAAKIDDELMREARLGCNKLKLLPTVAKLLLTPKCKLLQELLLSRGILGLLKNWVGEKELSTEILKSNLELQTTSYLSYDDINYIIFYP